MPRLLYTAEELIAHYQEMLTVRQLRRDPAQARIMKALAELLETLPTRRPRKKNLMSTLLAPKKLMKHNHGLYIYGDVGRGKSLVMDIFFEAAPVERKRRVHFHAFMQEIHATLHEWQKNKTPEAQDPLPHIARKIVEQSWLLCFDEFQVTDIADAMILGRLFEAMFQYGVVVVATSNRAPDDLYKDGLQRDRFLSAIAMLKQKLTVLTMDGDTDYRLKQAHSMKTLYMTPLGKKADAFLEECFDELTKDAEPRPKKIKINGRTLTLKRTHGDIAWCEFDELCNTPLGPADFIAIAEQCSTLLLANIPRLSPDRRNEAIRFITLIDELYEHKTKLICTAEVAMGQLYPLGHSSFEFQRTVSRLQEMQSDNYMKLPHKSE